MAPTTKNNMMASATFIGRMSSTSESMVMWIWPIQAIDDCVV
jgi:hypothetical protein